MLYPLVNYIPCNRFSNPYKAFLVAIAKIIKPRYYHETATDLCWHQALRKEIQAWKIIKLGPLKIFRLEGTINCKWFYKVKYKSDSTIERFKGRLLV